MATYNIRTSSVQDWRDTMMSKAEFNALAAERRANRAGSGFDEMGQHSPSGASVGVVNDGLWVLNTSQNTLYIGNANTNTAGISKTRYPLAAVNGTVNNIGFINSTSLQSLMLLPPAPTVLPYDATLTQQQIDSGVIKHADASNSGLIVNGKFDTDTSGWTAVSSTLSVDSGRLKVVDFDGSFGYARQNIPTIVGKKYILEVELSGAGTSDSPYATVGTVASAGSILSVNIGTATGRRTFEFTATESITVVGVAAGNGAGEYSLFDNIAVFPADAISRSDLVFLESWHEDVSEKDFVYPLGNVQYLGTTGDAGTPVAGAFAGSATYSLFSDTWQADGALVGKGYVWSTLSDANKKAFVANPENNCYLDGDKVIQVRYRMRVVMGWGDSWNTYDAQYGGSSQSKMLGYTGLISAGKVGVKGKIVSLPTVDLAYPSSSNRFVTSNTVDTIAVREVGAFAIEVTNTSLSHTGQVFALPMALVHRRNQGGYNATYNPNGSKLASDSLPWYSTTVSFASIADCFTESKLLATSGYIGTTTGRSDGIFYDQIHEGDITDLRMSSQKVQDYNRLIDREFNKLVAGTYRGTEGEFEIITFVGTLADGGTGFKYATFGKYPLYATSVFMINHTKGTSGASRFLKGDWKNQSISGSNLYAYYGEYTGASTGLDNKINFNGVQHSVGDSVTIYAAIPSTRTKSNTLTHTDIIGSPANYPTAWKQSGVNGTPLIVAEDGTSMLPTGALATFKLSRKANATPLQVLKSTDSGATWTALTVTTHYTFSTTSNVLTMVTAPAVGDLIMVTYQTHTSMAVPAVNSEVLAIGDVEAYNYYSNDGGQQIVCSLLGKVNSSTAANAHMHSRVPLSSIGISPVSFKLGTYTYYSDNAHTQLSLAVPNYISGVLKVFPYLTRSNGKAYLNLVFKEMKYGSYAAPTVVTAASTTYTQNMTYKVNIAGCALDGKVIQWTAATATGAVDWSLYDVSPTGVIYLLSSGAVYASARLYDGDSWGDDSKFNIVDNVSTTTDTNGATVLIGQKRVELPYFIGAAE